MKSLAFKVALSKKIGSGHFYRCSRLAKALKKKNVKTYIFLKENMKRYSDLNIDKSFDEIKIFRNSISEIKFLKKNNIKNYLIDDPNISLKYQSNSKRVIKNLIIYQDIPKKNYSDIIINHNNIDKGEIKYKKLSIKNTKHFIGPKYYFFPFTKKKIKIKREKIITIFLGGNTPIVYLKKILEILNKLNFKNYKIEIIKGIFNKDIIFLKKKFFNLNIKNINQSNQIFFINRLSKSKIFISAGGSTLIESIYLNTPVITICRTKNQENNCKNFSKNKLIYNLGKKVNDTQLCKFLKILILNKKSYLDAQARMEKYKKKELQDILAKVVFNQLY
jgi:UDP-2,4-diacetamido-2,4,6-trideoxy-beta-L-altropyranose hydrolase